MIAYRLYAAAEPMQPIADLFRTYAASIGIDLGFQDFERELADLPGEYAEPDGAIVVAESAGRLAGCVALRKLAPGVCEMKRLFVKPEFRGRGIGKRLVEEIVRIARTKGYAAMRLDTLATMREAVKLYEAAGFKEIEPYRFNPLPGAMFMELDLSPGKGCGE